MNVDFLLRADDLRWARQVEKIIKLWAEKGKKKMTNVQRNETLDGTQFGLNQSGSQHFGLLLNHSISIISVPDSRMLVCPAPRARMWMSD